MHPVFVAAVKRNQIGVAPQEFAFLVSTPPGTIPATVRPPRIPELADAPVVAARRLVAVACLERGLVVRRWPLPRPTTPAGREIERHAACSAACSHPRSSRSQPRRATARSIAWPRLVGLAATTRTPRRPKLRPRRRRSRSRRPSRPAWPRMARSAPKQAEAAPIKTTEAQAPAAPAAAATPRRASTGQRDERRGAGGADRQLRQPLVGLPLDRPSNCLTSMR